VSGLGLGLKAEFGCFESVVLRHCMFGPIQAIENQLTEEGKSHLTCNGEMLFYLLVRQKDLVATIFAT